MAAEQSTSNVEPASSGDPQPRISHPVRREIYALLDREKEVEDRQVAVFDSREIDLFGLVEDSARICQPGRRPRDAGTGNVTPDHAPA